MSFMVFEITKLNSSYLNPSIVPIYLIPEVFKTPTLKLGFSIRSILKPRFPYFERHRLG